jgi:hypothetical protein
VSKHTWNYRIVRHKAGHLALHEVHYEDDQPTGMTTEPITFGTAAYIVSSEGVEAARQEVINGLALALADAIKRPVFEPPETW